MRKGRDVGQEQVEGVGVGRRGKEEGDWWEQRFLFIAFISY